jgi:predicted N-acetyltransferase YhbS
MHSDFHLTNRVFSTQVIQSQDLDLSSSFVLEMDGEVQGGIIIKTWNRTVIPKYNKMAWITFLFVAPAYRNRGFGRQLMEQAKQVLSTKGYTTLQVGKDMNNLFCGIADVFGSNGFFDALGAINQGKLYDLHHHVTPTSFIDYRNVTQYTMKVCTQDDASAVQAFFHRVFPGRWEEEFEEYKRTHTDLSGFVIFYKDDRVVAFCRVNDPEQSQPMYNALFTQPFDRLIGVGPLGVDPDYRGLSLGYDVTAFGINTAIERGASDIIIDWTEHVDLYRKFGFEIWHVYDAYRFTL